MIESSDEEFQRRYHHTAVFRHWRSRDSTVVIRQYGHWRYGGTMSLDAWWMVMKVGPSNSRVELGWGFRPDDWYLRWNWRLAGRIEMELARIEERMWRIWPIQVQPVGFGRGSGGVRWTEEYICWGPRGGLMMAGAWLISGFAGGGLLACVGLLEEDYGGEGCIWTLQWIMFVLVGIARLQTVLDQVGSLIWFTWVVQWIGFGWWEEWVFIIWDFSLYTEESGGEKKRECLSWSNLELRVFCE